MLRRLPDEASPVLGPPAYYLALADFLDRHGSRRHARCYLPDAALQLFDTGALTPCPVGWTAEIGNLKTGDAGTVMAEVGRHKMYDLLTREPPRVPVCRNCFSQADIVTLFIAGAVSIEEITRMPMYGTAEARGRLLELRERLSAAKTSAAAPSFGSTLALV